MLLLLTVGLAGCQVHTHRIGSGPTGLGAETARQYYWMFGLLQLNEVNVQRMAADLNGYEIRSEISFFDLLITSVLFPLTITTRTVTVER